MVFSCQSKSILQKIESLPKEQYMPFSTKSFKYLLTSYTVIK